jgi:hypothetical protein
VTEPWEGDSPCEECGAPNICWFAPNRVWNAIMGDDKQKTICVVCFAKRADERGYRGAWLLAPEQENDEVFWDIAQTLTDEYGTIRETQLEGEVPAFGRNIVATVLAYFKDTPWPGYAMRGWGRTRR